MNIPRYEFQPLIGPDEIRVLELRATRSRLEVRIHHRSVSSGSFEALSYVWGKPGHVNKAIVLDALDWEIGWIPLTMNLGNAMRDLRDAEELEGKVFWIDQICINQEDDAEKAHQVAMMNQIYMKARRVVAYLGPAGLEEEETRGIRLLERICKTIPDGTWPQIHEAGSFEQIRAGIIDGGIQFERLPLDLELESDKAHDKKEISKRYIEQGWEWLVRVAYSELTQRLWIVQEQLLNKEIVTLRGLRLIDWDNVTTIPILFAIGHLPRQYRDTGRRSVGETSLAWDKIEEILYGIWWDRHARQENKAEYTWSSLFHNLQWYQPLLCADARDRVYGILAISRDAKALALEPDYSPLNTVEVLSKQLSIRVIEEAINLELLVYAISWRRPNSTLPSWCLTLDHSVNANTPEALPFEEYTPHPKPYRYYPGNFRVNTSVLVVKGQILDYVSTPNPRAPSPCNHNQSISSQLDFLSSLGYLLPNGFCIEDVVSILRTITARAPWSPPANAHVSANEVMAFHFWAYLRHKVRLLLEVAGRSRLNATTNVLEHCNQIATEVRRLTPYIQQNPELQQTGDVARAEYTAYNTVLRYVLEQGRCLGRTRSGRFFNAMCTITKDDSIVALQGADRLFAIRWVGNAYKLIGDIFVDGLMHEEAYEDQDPDKVDYDIELE